MIAMGPRFLRATLLVPALLPCVFLFAAYVAHLLGYGPGHNGLGGVAGIAIVLIWSAVAVYAYALPIAIKQLRRGTLERSAKNLVCVAVPVAFLVGIAGLAIALTVGSHRP